MISAGAKRAPEQHEYLVKYTSGTSIFVPSRQANNFFPSLVINFLESNLEWSLNGNIQNEATFVETAMPEEPPVSITCNVNIFCYFIFTRIQIFYVFYSSSDVTNVCNKINYLVEFEDGGKMFVSSEGAKREWPSLVLQFLEENLAFD